MRKPIIAVSMAIIAIYFINACTGKTSHQEKTSTPVVSTVEDKVKTGERLVAALDCEICHSPKKMGPQGPEIIPELRFGGHQSNMPLPPADEKILKSGWVLFAPDFTSFIGPWGQSYAANISSDSTGIGLWTEDQFKKVIKEGKFMGLENTRPILPPMPWAAYKNLTDDEISAVFAFLKSTKPVYNIVPEAKIAAPPKM